MTELEYNERFTAHEMPIGNVSPLGRLMSVIKLNVKEFAIQERSRSIDYFPDYIKDRLDRYHKFFESSLRPVIASMPMNNSKGTLDIEVGEVLLKLSEGVNEVVSLYYSGNISKATTVLNNIVTTMLDREDGMRQKMLIVDTIEPNAMFYRARQGKGKTFTKSDLFHVSFDKRHIVSTNRYSIPGMPALYVSTDPYTCFMELDQPDLKTLNFSLLGNTTALRILQIQRVEDAIFNLLKENTEARQTGNLVVLAWDLEAIANYLATFPLVIACTVKTQNPNSTFKPEYIIPQLLIQNLHNEGLIDGIKYPSTKIKYPEGAAVEVFYNYVFPVKTTQRAGYCSELSRTFKMTEPTSLEIEKMPSALIKAKGLNSLYTVVNKLEALPKANIMSI